MKVLRNRGLLVYSISFQIATMIIICQSTKDLDSTIDELKLIEVFHNTLNPPNIKISLLVNTREIQSTIQLDLPATRDLSLSEKIDFKKPLVFLIHGFLSDGSEEWLMQLTRAYLERKDVNVLIVDWGTGALTIDYFAAVEKITSVSDELVRFTELLIAKTDVRASGIHIIGHSLGAHIAGLVGRKIPGLNRITGLDPAGYEFPSKSLRLSSKDATHVDVVHTSNLFGTSSPLGQVDFYINGGEVQPKCENNPDTENIFDWFFGNVCSHGKAIDYFIESINNSKCLFVGTETIGEAFELQSKDFDKRKHSVLGLDTFKYHPRGVLYIVTNDSPPYCKNSSKN